jgi:hypothetical protein
MTAHMVRVPLRSGGEVLVEVSTADLPDEVVLATGEPGKAVGRLGTSLEDALDSIEPALSAVSERLRAAMPNQLTIEFGMKMGGETGLILAKGTAEVNFKVSMSWSGD